MSQLLRALYFGSKTEDTYDSLGRISLQHCKARLNHYLSMTTPEDRMWRSSRSGVGAGSKRIHSVMTWYFITGKPAAVP